MTSIDYKKNRTIKKKSRKDRIKNQDQVEEDRNEPETRRVGPRISMVVRITHEPKAVKGERPGWV